MALFRASFWPLGGGVPGAKPGSPTTKHLNEVIELMRAQRITVVLANPYFDPRGAQLVAQQTGRASSRWPTKEWGRGEGPTIICRWLTTMCASAGTALRGDA